jgi:RNA polymerase sigma-70 factor (ECF subfamily)
MSDSFVKLGLTNAHPFEVASAQTKPSFDEITLVEGLREAREVAYEELIARFQQPVYNIVFRMLNNASDANDVVQEVFFKVFRSIGKFRNESSLKTWIFRIAVNEACNRRRYFNRHLRQEVELENQDETLPSVADRLASNDPSPFDLTLGREHYEILELALANINPLYRAAVILRDIEELSYEEITDVLQIALGTVKSRILRGREALRLEYLEQIRQAEDLTMEPQTAE